jgi:hypothetical protein
MKTKSRKPHQLQVATETIKALEVSVLERVHGGDRIGDPKGSAGCFWN